jgi:hypothetical protein
MIPDLSPAARRQVADQLGVSPEALPADAKAAFLRRLPGAGFLPPPPLCAAAAALTDRRVPGAAGTIVDNEDNDLRTAVTAFVREFWSLAPASRREKWRDLLNRSAADPLLAARVRRLESGIDLASAVERAATPRQRQLVGMAETLFVLGPIERAARRRELLDGLPPPTGAWEAAAREIARDFPAHAALEPALVERLSTWRDRPKAAARAVGRPAPTWGFQAQGGLNVPRVRRPVKASGGQRVPVWPWILLVSIVLRGLASFGTSERPQPTWQLPVYSSPRVTQPYAPPAPVIPVDQELIRRSLEALTPVNPDPQARPGAIREQPSQPPLDRRPP